ncbi:MAG TPA: hypothetical protein VF070_35870 [Streptosporangiaceae bacterium]
MVKMTTNWFRNNFRKITVAAALMLAGGTGAVLAAAPAANAAPVARAAPAAVHIDAELTALWTKVLETPSPQNPFGTGGDPAACWVLPDGTLAPFGFVHPFAGTCTVKPGTKFLVVGSSVECSTLPGDTPPEPPGTAEAVLRACAVSNDLSSAPVVTVDGSPVPVREVETSLMNITLPASNIFPPDPAGTTGQSVGHGWVAHVDPLTPGTHTFASPGLFSTQIVVSGG